MIEAEQIMKRCQAGTRNYNEANNLHAACYGMIGKLLMKLNELESQEPVACDCNQGQVCHICDPITPSQRTWVGLTNEDIDHIYTGVRAVLHDVNSYVFCRAIEARLKELNT